MDAADTAGGAQTGLSSWECHDGIFDFPEDRELKSGVLNGDAIHVFTYGHCHSFAEAVRRLCPTAQLIFAYDAGEDDEEMEDVQGHVLVRIDGRYLDVRGWIDELTDGDEANDRFEDMWDRVKEIEPEGWLANSDGWLDLRIDDATPFAISLLEQAGIAVDDEARLRAAMLKEVCR